MGHRSFLYCPGDDREMMEKAVRTGADAVVFDLEDAVAPGAKVAARQTVVDTLDALADPDPAIGVRVNPYDRSGPVDVEALLGAETRPDGVLLPKVDAAETVAALHEDLSDTGAGDVGIVPLVETAAGLLAAEEIAAAPGVVAVAYGDQDYTADVGATVTDDKTESLYARQKVVAAAAAAGVDAIDTVHTDIDDRDGLRNQTRLAVEFGFDGKLAIHPDQITVINEAYTPPPADVDWAETVLERQRAADEAETGVFTVDGQMIDPPLVERARTIIERAEAAGVRQSDG